MSKKVSIIIPCYNQGKYVSEAIEAALNQTYQDIEIVCVNDASQDNTEEVIKGYTEKYENIVFINSEVNGGLPHSRNIAIEKATGEYILPLDADDKIDPTYVEKAVDIMESNPQIGMVYCEAELFGKKHGKWNLPEFDEKLFIFQNVIFCSSVFRKSDWLRAGKYNENMKIAWEDWDFWLSFIELGLKPYKIPETLFYYRKHYHKSMLKKVPDFQKTLWKQIVNNHPKLYLNSDESIERIFISADTHSKYLKYKKVFKILLPIIIIENILLLLYIFYKLTIG